MAKFKIAIDVDETLIKKGSDWLEYINKLTGKQETLETLNVGNTLLNYAVDKSFKAKHPEYKDTDFSLFWRQHDLYDGDIIDKQIIEVIESLNKDYNCDIIFITGFMPEHMRSKFNLLQRSFPFLDLVSTDSDSAFIMTWQKHHVNFDCLIDDRLVFFGKLKDKVLKIQIDSPYSQEMPNHKLDLNSIKVDLKTTDWNQIKDFIVDLL